MAFLRKETCNLRDPMHLRHPVSQTLAQKAIKLGWREGGSTSCVCMCVCVYVCVCVYGIHAYTHEEEPVDSCMLTHEVEAHTHSHLLSQTLSSKYHTRYQLNITNSTISCIHTHEVQAYTHMRYRHTHTRGTGIHTHEVQAYTHTR